MLAPAGILFTAFEPSGDALGAGLIAQLRARCPDVPIWALGGPKMAAAGAQLIETTTERAVMLAGAAAHAAAHHRRVGRLRAWLADHKIAALAPVDSPAANWSICKLVRRAQPEAKIVHSAAPQLWAWAPWRIRKLRRLTDHVLCLLPFEPAWFESRGVPATFVGHPIFDVPPGERAREQNQGDASEWPTGPVKLALLPGSRPGEWKKNWATMLHVAAHLYRRHPGLRLLVAAVDQPAADAMLPLPPIPWDERDYEEMREDASMFKIAQTDAVLAWADVVLVVSGTATLQVAAHGKPMVALYNANRLAWSLVGRWLIRTRTFILPNLIAEWAGLGRVVPEFVPHFGEIEPLVEALDQLIRDPAAAARQREGLARVCSHFTGRSFAQAAAEQFLKVTGLGSESSL